MSGSTETPLKLAMKLAGVGQEELAERLGVSGQTVYYWSSGRRTIPPARVGLVAEALGVPEDRLASMVTPASEARQMRLALKEEPTTLFAFCVANVWAGIGSDFSERCEILAEAAGVTLYDIRDWLDGRAKIPADVLHAWAEEVVGGLNPLVFKHEAKVEDPEAEPKAVMVAIKTMRNIPPASFAEAARSLSQMHMDFLASDMVSPAAQRAALDNGREVPELLWAKAEEFAR